MLNSFKSSLSQSVRVALADLERHTYRWELQLRSLCSWEKREFGLTRLPLRGAGLLGCDHVFTGLARLALNLFFWQAVSLLEAHNLHVRVLWGTSCPDGPGAGVSQSCPMSQPHLFSCFEGSPGKILFHPGELGRKSNKYGECTLTSSRISLPLRP